MLVLAALILFLCSSEVALAQLPDPGNSGIPDIPPQPIGRLGASPLNDLITDPTFTYSFAYTLRDASNAPVPDFPASEVALDFSGCTHASTRPSDLIHPDGPSEVNGTVLWRQSLTFGGAAPCEVRILVSGVEFLVLPGAPLGGVRSPDNNGDGWISLADLQLYQMAFAEQQPTWRGDLNGDDQIALADLVFLQHHFNFTE